MEGIILSQKYKITRLLNGGTFCKLYEAIHLYKNKKVAIKCESSEIGKKILENEINMYIYLKKYKINIPNIKDIGIYENYKYIVMELLNITLKDYMKRYTDSKKFIDMAAIMYNLFDVINPFHERCLVHRDIKPENFIFDTHYNLYIIDLGLSAFVSNRVMHTFIGNRLYASYNCHKTEYVYTQKDDLISIMYMLLHLYTGILPWDKTSFDQTIKPKEKTFDYNSFPKEVFRTDSHSVFYNLKKNTNYKDFYTNHNKYDENVKCLIDMYNKIINTNL
jgi:serine/threonine protein kinase